MKISWMYVALAVASGATAQSTVSAPCGTSCPTTVPDKMITRSKSTPTETAPCPSVVVSSIAGNGSSVTGTGTPSPSAFKGAADHATGHIGVAAFVGAAAALFAL